MQLKYYFFKYLETDFCYLIFVSVIILLLASAHNLFYATLLFVLQP